MDRQFQSHLESVLGSPIISEQAISGGDISKVFLIKTRKDRFILKYLKSKENLDILTSETKGLAFIRQTESIAVPEVYFQQEFESIGYIIMEFIESKRADPIDFENLASHLFALHNNSNTHHGLISNNHIGKLPQNNTYNASWSEFYINQRLIPQLELGVALKHLNQNTLPSVETIVKRCTTILGETVPSLLHGDLWSGNFLIATDGTPYIIDPAVYYGDRMVDIAMSKLFGGFDTNFYRHYYSLSNELKDTSQKVDIYQLYFLLVHLNLFGLSYYPQVNVIMNRYFS